MTDILNQMAPLATVIVPILIACADLFKKNVVSQNQLKLTPLFVFLMSVTILYLYDSGFNA